MLIMGGALEERWVSPAGCLEVLIWYGEASTKLGLGLSRGVSHLEGTPSRTVEVDGVG